MARKFRCHILEVKPMSNPTTPHERKKKRDIIMHHAKQPHGIALIVMVLFVIAWSMWTFVIW
jgi:hypothetical protein